MDQKTQFSAAIAVVTGRLRVCIEDGVDDAKLLSRDFKTACIAAGWDPVGNTVRVMADERPDNGLCLRVSDPALLTRHQVLVREALKAIGFHVDTRPIPERLAKEPVLADAEILISRRMT